MKFNIISKLCLLALIVLPLSANAQSNTKLSIEDFSIKAGETKTMTIDLDNPDMEVTLVQFNLYLPEGLSIAIEDGEYVTDIARTTYKKHSLDANAHDGYTIFMLSSSKNATLSGSSGAIITIDLTADSSFKSGTIALRNIVIVAPDEAATTTKPADVEITIGETAIEGVTVDDKVSSDIYDLSGRRVRSNVSTLDGLSKGIYLINGKKVVKN